MTTVAEYIAQMREAGTCEHCRLSVRLRTLASWYDSGAWTRSTPVCIAMLGTALMLLETGAMHYMADHEVEAFQRIYKALRVASPDDGEVGAMTDLFGQPNEGGAQ